ncbi:isochorismatase family protein [Alcaligenes faecalis]|uniref:isochorismatase family protein n=1 Tax=Alcaligenes faecalis TaxID=511 RepID=UPI00211C16E1|nr:isochorismatase family protein [Alcaligenes faecalis]UUO11290.1 isochorismatase family protein [Alcaligenes faecalis]
MRDSDNLKGGFDGTLPMGQQPALVVIDFQRGFTEPGLTPLASNCDSQIEQTNTLIRAMRGKGRVIFTIIGYEAHLADANLWLTKASSLRCLLRGSPACELDPRLDYDPEQDIILYKTQASAFYGTPLPALLAHQGCDMLIVAGATTSGCVRASVVDSLQSGFAPFVAEDAVADRSAAQHRSNLIDMASKYAEVLPSADLIAHLQTL